MELRSQLDRLESILGISKTDDSTPLPGPAHPFPLDAPSLGTPGLLEVRSSRVFSLTCIGGNAQPGPPLIPIPLALPETVSSPALLLPDRARTDECLRHFLSLHYSSCPFGHLPTLWNRLFAMANVNNRAREDWQLTGLMLAICAFSAGSMAMGDGSARFTVVEARTLADKAVQALTSGRRVGNRSLCLGLTPADVQVHGAADLRCCGGSAASARVLSQS